MKEKNFTPIDYTNWERREIYEMFQGTTMYTTVQLDITDFLRCIKEKGFRFYPTLIYCISRVVNSSPDYRYGYDENKNIGIWNEIHPMYTVSRKDKPQLFSMIVTYYKEDFQEFYQNFLKDYAIAENSNQLLCGTHDIANENIMGITAMPGLHFSSFAFGSETKPDFTPFVILGKYGEKEGRIILPVCGEFAHAVNDGYHISHFFAELEKVMNSFNSLLS